MFTSHSLDMIHYLSKFTLNNPIHNLIMIEIPFTRWGNMGIIVVIKFKFKFKFRYE